MKKEISIWDKIDDDLSIDRKIDREESCGIDHWIFSKPDGLRTIKTYHCGTCDECKHREALELQSRLYSLAYTNPINAIKAPPKAIDNFVKSIDTKDYVRFPSSDGSDYLFSIGGAGINFFDVEFSWENIISRRKGTRKSGKLIVFKKDEPEQTIPMRNARASSYIGAVDALRYAVKLLNEKGEYPKRIDNETDLVTENNIFNAHILNRLREKGVYIFDYTGKHGYTLPITFKPEIEDNTEKTDE